MVSQTAHLDMIIPEDGSTEIDLPVKLRAQIPKSAGQIVNALAATDNWRAKPRLLRHRLVVMNRISSRE